MSANNASLLQLVDMGICRARATAALKRTKGDVMSAAERVFSGEFDDIPSDDDEDEDEIQTNTKSESGRPKRALSRSGLQTPKEESSRLKRSIKSEISCAVEDQDVELSSDDNVIEISDSDDALDDGDDAHYAFEEDEEGEHQLFSDPYAGIFFSNDRIERIVEPDEEPEYAEVQLDSPSNKTKVRILGRGEWMSGCPEGNEQSFLFQSYSALTDGSMPCSAGCGHSFERKTSDFFALFPEFSAYVTYLSNIIQPTCPKCQAVTCKACGECITENSIGRTYDMDSGKGKGKMKKLVEGEVEALLHCLEVQGVLIGVGLSMIERTFSEPKRKIKASTIDKRQASFLAALDDAAGVNNSPKSGDKPKYGKKSKQKDEDEDEDEDMNECDSESPEDPLSDSAGENRKDTASGKGTGYSGNALEDRSGQEAAQKTQKLADEKTVLLLSQVRVYLPSLNRESGTRTSDHLVHPTALAHLRRRSAFVNDLLRNDSLVDMSNRGELYRVLFDWLEVISNHEALAGMLAMPQMRPTRYEPIPEVNPPSGLDSAPAPQKTVLVTYEAASSPRELLENCVIQAQAALKGLRATTAVHEDNPDEEKETEETKRLNIMEAALIDEQKKKAMEIDANIQLKDFCNRIIASAQAIDRSLVEVKGKKFVERMKESLPKLPESGGKVDEVDVNGQSDDAIVRSYENWAMKARFQYCDMKEPESSDGEYRHAYSSSIKGLELVDAPKRSLAIAKELAILTTSLPVAWHSTIFLRVDEARVDCLKAMIIGPEGTPYQNGCFIFDIFLPLEYNLKSPVVKSMTTNGGKYRYNPNLYADGKVCLSLLGTWQGPGWISGQSTLLQVLISLQSLILCEEPYLNEPGWASMGGSPQSKTYSANVRRMVVADAMVNNLKNPPFPFEDEIKTHFRLKSKTIRAQLEAWGKEDDGKPITADSYRGTSHGKGKGGEESGSSTAFDKHAKAMRGLLDRLDGLDLSADVDEGEADGERAESGSGSGSGSGSEVLVNEI